jgi:hypothetical protein
MRRSEGRERARERESKQGERERLAEGKAGTIIGNLTQPSFQTLL